MTRTATLLGLLLTVSATACDNGSGSADAAPESKAEPKLTVEEQAAKDVVALAKATGEYFKRTGECVKSIRMTPPNTETCREGCLPKEWEGDEWSELGWKPDGPRTTHFGLDVEDTGETDLGEPYCILNASAWLDADGDKQFREFYVAAIADRTGISSISALRTEGGD